MGSLECEWDIQDALATRLLLECTYCSCILPTRWHQAQLKLDNIISQAVIKEKICNEMKSDMNCTEFLKS